MDVEHSDSQEQIQRFTGKQVLFSFYVTQTFFFIVGLLLLWWQGRLHWQLFDFSNGTLWGWGIAIGLLIVGIDLLVDRFIPEKWTDDGGINRLLFAGRSPLHILFISLIAGFVEEMVFRGAIQYWLGVWGSSLLFLLVHTRYLKKWFLVLIVGLISLLFGWMVEWSGTLTPAIIAHVIVDFLMGLYIRYLSD